MKTQMNTMEFKPTRRSIVKHFDGEFYTKYLAKTYEHATRLTGWRVKILEHALEGLTPGKILDVGCGTGFLLDQARARGFTIQGADPSAGMIEQAKLKYGFKDSEITLCHSDKLPFADETFDYVVASGAMIYVNNIEDTAREMARVVKKGGLVRILDHARPKKKNLATPLVFLFTQASGHLIHDYEFYFSKVLKLVRHKTLGRGGYMQLFDFMRT